MKNLYIIGNGFDLHHGLDTKYQSFAKFLFGNYNELYELILSYYYLPNISSSTTTDEEYAQWANFEMALADLDYKQILDDKSDFIARPGSVDFKDRDWHSYQIEMEIIIERLTTDLINAFNTFILNVNYPKNINERKIQMLPNSLFLNFNYTETLEMLYKINNENILYIHNKSTETDETDSKIILGHGTDPLTFKEKKPEPPKNISEIELEEWNENMANQYDFSYESAKDEILTYYTKAFKNTQEIINSNISFFQKLKSIEKIYILGHSISPVDIKYFITIKNQVNNNVKWNVSYYSEKEKEKHLNKLLEIGVKRDNINQIKIERLIASA